MFYRLKKCAHQENVQAALHYLYTVALFVLYVSAHLQTAEIVPLWSCQKSSMSGEPLRA